MDKPYYPYSAISTIDSLAKCLGVAPRVLRGISDRIEHSYTEFTIESKAKDRTVYEPKFELKRIQKRINHRIFEHVKYPHYLHGGIRDEENKRDYVENALLHSKNPIKTIIGLDVKNFYDNIKKDKVLSIFKHFFSFPDEVSEVLTELTTYKGKVPQGACTSSYLANLVFFNSEYSIVSKFRGLGIYYSRLLDDVTLSSEKELTECEISKVIKDISSLFKKYGLKINNKKTRIEYRNSKECAFEVTGLWVGHSLPKLRRKERRYIRTIVHACEREYGVNPYSENYHELWNKASGLVAKLNRLDQSNHKSLRLRLKSILPLYNEHAKIKVIKDCKSLLKINPDNLNYGQLKRLNVAYSRLAILSRSYKGDSRYWRRQLRMHFKKHPTNSEVW